MAEAKTKGLAPLRAGAPDWLCQLYRRHEAASELLASAGGEYERLCGELERTEAPSLEAANAHRTATLENLKHRLVDLEIQHGVPQIEIPDPKRPLVVPDGPAQEQDKDKRAAPSNEMVPKEPKETPKGRKAEKKPKEKKEKQEGGKQGAKGAAERAVDVSRLDLRVGFILEAKLHPDAESLYVETVDCGDEAPRTVVSGLVRHVPLDQMQQRPVVVLCNLKPAKMRGVESAAMVMCASTPEKVEILSPPPHSRPGDAVRCAAFPGDPDPQLQPKKKIWEAVAPDLKTNAEGQVVWKDHILLVDGNPITAPSLKNVQVK